LVITLLALASGTRTSDAQGAIEMGLDMVTTGNTANTLGSIQTCYRVTPSGTSFDGVADWTIDVYVAGDTQAPTAYDAWVTYDSSVIHVLDSGTDALTKLPGASDFTTDEDSGPIKSSDGELDAGALYLSGGPGIAGDGTIVRIGLDINFAAGPTVVTFGFAKGKYRSAAGLHTVTTVAGRLAINGTCSVGGIAELPDVASGAASSSRYSMALALAVVTGAIVLAAGAVYAGKRRFR
jgi:hypothetical protein